MLYYLFNYLQDKFDLPGSRLFEYVTVRAMLAIILSLILSIWLGKSFIRMLKKYQISEVQRDVKIDPFNVNKVGVPTMGGLVIITSILASIISVFKI